MSPIAASFYIMILEESNAEFRKKDAPRVHKNTPPKNEIKPKSFVQKKSNKGPREEG